MWCTVVQEGLRCSLSTLAYVSSVWWKWTTARLDTLLTLPCSSPVTTHTHTHMHTHTPIPGGQRPVNPQVREEEQRLVRIFMTIAVLVVILIVFA